MVTFKQTEKMKVFRSAVNNGGLQIEKPFPTIMDFWWTCILIGMRWDLINYKAKLLKQPFLNSDNLISELAQYKDKMMALWFQKYCERNSFSSKEDIKKAINAAFDNDESRRNAIPPLASEDLNAYAYGGYVYLKEKQGTEFGVDFLLLIEKLLQKEPEDKIRDLVKDDDF